MTPPENSDENASSHDIPENGIEAVPEEEQVLNPPVAKDEESNEIEGQSQISSNQEQHPMINENSVATNCKLNVKVLDKQTSN